MSSDETAPESTLPYPPIHTDKKFIVLSDWDGTITNYDSNDYMTDNLGYGKEKRREGNLSVLGGKTTFRDAFREMLESVSSNGHTFEECKELLRKNILLDTGFKEFNTWCKENDVPVIIVSSGMAPIIRAVLSNLVGDKDASEIDIIANDAVVRPNGSWEIKYRHPSSGYGHDKSQAILPYRKLPNPPTLFFFGDGVSDISAARHADVLFVKEKPGGDNDLAAYCRKHGIKHIIFEDFSRALGVVKAIVAGEKTIDEAVAAGKA
ncbi:HAD-like domain containing protein [Amanita muscaria]